MIYKSLLSETERSTTAFMNNRSGVSHYGSEVRSGAGTVAYHVREIADVFPRYPLTGVELHHRDNLQELENGETFR